MPVVHSRHHAAAEVRVDDQSCTACGLCTTVCPTGVLRLEAGQVRVHPECTFGCIACAQCMMICPRGSVTVHGRGLTPDDLVPLPPPERKASIEALEALMLARRSVRHFTDRPIPSAAIARIVAAAATAPMGIPPWDVGCVAIENRERVREVAFAVARGYEGLTRVLTPGSLRLLKPFLRKTTYAQFRTFVEPLARTYVEHYRRGEDVIFFGAPAVLIFHHSPYADLADATIACTYAMLAAEALGLSGTMIGGAPPLMRRNRALCRELGIPAGNRPALALILGYPAVTYRRAVRRRFLQ